MTREEAEAKKKVISANADAEAILAEAQAQADANKLLEESLSNKVLVYEQIEKWNGVMPKVTDGGNGLFLNIDVEDTTKTPAATTQAEE